MLASSTWLLDLVVMEHISIGWGSHVIHVYVHVTCFPDGNPEKSTKGLWNQLYASLSRLLLHKQCCKLFQFLVTYEIVHAMETWLL